MSNQHFLKIHPAPLAELMSGAKTAEVRRNDRDFHVGDTVCLIEVNPETDNDIGNESYVRTISHIQTGYGLPDGMCVLSYADTAQREALARMEAERNEVCDGLDRQTARLIAAQAQLAEALKLIDQHYNDLGDACGAFQSQHDVDIVERFLDVLQAFVARHAQAKQQEAKPATFYDAIRNPPRIAPTLQQEAEEAQGAQAGDERAAFEAWHRSRFATKGLTGDPTRDMHNGIKAEKYGPEEQQIRWECWQARAALATQPAGGEPVAPKPIGYISKHAAQDLANGRLCTITPDRMLDDGQGWEVPVYAAPPAAAHGDEAVRKDAERYRFLKSDVNPSLMRELDFHYLANEWDTHIDAAMRAQGDGEVSRG